MVLANAPLTVDSATVQTHKRNVTQYTAVITDDVSSIHTMTHHDTHRKQ